MKSVHALVKANSAGGGIVPTVHKRIGMLVWERIQIGIWRRITVELDWVLENTIDAHEDPARRTRIS